MVSECLLNLKQFSVMDIDMSPNGIGYARVGCDNHHKCKNINFRGQKSKMRAYKFADQQANK